jgi:hypothetical protein
MYFIRDCNNKIVGNPNGYRTFEGAERQQNSYGTPAHRAIWDAVFDREPIVNGSIKIVE